MKSSSRLGSQSEDLDKYEKSRVRRKSSLGAFEMGRPMFDFQRRQLLNTKSDDRVTDIGQIDPPKKKFKVMLLGDSGVGKSALLARYSEGNWPLSWIPDVSPQPVEVETEDSIVEIWDTSGKKEYDNIRQFTFLRSKVFLTCFSIDDRDSLNNVIMKWIPMAQNWSNTALIVMVCMKSDLGDVDNTMKALDLEDMENPKHTNELLKSFEWRDKAKEMGVPLLECTSTKSLDSFSKELTELIQQHFDKSA